VSVLATRGVASAEPYLTRYVPAFALAGVLPVLTLVAIASQDQLSAVIVGCTLPLVPVFGALVGLATRDRADEQWRAMASLSSHFLDVVRGLPTLVVHRRATAQSRTIAQITDRYREAALRTLRLAFASSAVLELVATLSVALVAVVVGVRLASGGLDLHTALVVLLLAPEAYWPLRRVGAEFHAAAEGVATFEAVDELDSPAPAPAGAYAGTGGLVVDALTVRYPGRSVPALNDLSLRIPDHGVTVVTGPSGCGKTTLLSAIAGLVPAESGSVTRGGQPVHGESWRSQIAWLPQRPVFVAGTIADNLRLAAPLAQDEDLLLALRRVALEERVLSLGDGLDTDLDEDGANLSAGERARLALARIVLADRPWVLLDEPTAHLDDLTERVIVDTIVELGRTSAVVVVAHRPAIAGIADLVLELPAGARSGGMSGGIVRDETATARVVRDDSVDKSDKEQRDRLGLSGPAAPSRTASMWPSTLLGALASASGVALTATAGWLIVQASTKPAVLTLMVAIVAVRTFGLARPVLRYAERLRSHDVALRLLARRRVQVYDALVPLTPGRLGKRRGDVLSAIVDDVDGVVDRELRVRLPARVFVLVTLLAGAVAWAVLPVAGLSVALSAGASGSLAFGLARIGAARAERAAVERRADLSGEVVEVMQTSTELVMWQAEARAEHRVARASDRTGRAVQSAARWMGAGRGLALVGAGLGVAATALVAEPFVGTSELSGPMMALLVLLPLALADLTVPLADAGALSARTAAAARRLKALEQAAPLVADTPRRPLPASSHLELRDATGGWTPGSVTLEDLSLALPPGARIGVIGRSGSGKSTLAAMLLRFLDPRSGEATLGGTPTHWLGLDDLRSVVGLVDDDPHVFGTTLVENIRLARPDATDAEVADALRQARLGDWVSSLPDGLDTWLGDGHASVSGGERARLGIARALLSSQRVLVLDEPIAHLDHATAERLADEVLSGPRDRSILWITHAPVGLDLVDEVVDLDAEVNGSTYRPAARRAS
jgi:ATP-binding cassette subfamily C protein CydCD